jgi:adenylate kinase
MSVLRLVFLGPPGTGKGTQARRLSDVHDLAPLSSGDVLRAEMEAGSPIGQIAKQYVVSGTLVPDEVVTGVMLAAVDKLGPDRGFILDGFPRTVPQAEALDAGLAQRGMRIDAVIDFDLSDEEIRQRILDRRVCSKCQRTYNVSFVPPRKAGVCDVCGGALVQRPDDRRQVIDTRLETYRAQTSPLIAFYRVRGVLRSVDARADAGEVERAVQRVVRGLGSGG